MGERRWWWSSFGGVRARVTAAATLAVAGVLVVASVLLVARQRSGLVDQLDEALGAEAERIAAAVESGDVPQLGEDDDDRLVAVVDQDGEVVAASGALDDVAELGGGEDDERDVEVDGERLRVVSDSYDVADGRVGEGLVHVAASLEDLDASVADLRTSLIGIVPVATLALGVLVWFVVGWTLRPVERIRAEVASYGMSDLSRRVPEPSSDDEIARLAVTMNEMLARMEDAVRRQQRFVADASHELRTPLTRMRSELEVDERQPDSADPAATRRSVLEEIVALQRLIEDLLTLARGDAGTAARHRLAVDLDDVVLDEVRAVPGTGVAIDTSVVSAAQVIGDGDELRRVVRNLLDNARRHARSAVTVELGERDGEAILVVADDGAGIPPERRTAVLERFTRLDEARSGGSARAGLGLAIVHDIVTRHKGTVVVDESPAGGARFTVTMPAASSETPAPREV